MSARLKKALTWIAIIAHGLFVLTLLFHPHFAPKPLKNHRLSVKVVQPKVLQPKVLSSKPIQAPKSKNPPTSTAKQLPAAQKETAPPKKKPSPQTKKIESGKKTPPATSLSPKKTMPKPPAKSTPKKEQRASTKQSKVSEDLVRELEESIAKIEEKQDNFKQESRNTSAKSTRHVPLTPLSSLDPAPMFAISSREEITEMLVQELRSVLHLPDFGEVKVRLSFRSDGSIAEVTVLKADSKKNGAYLERELPKHLLPFIADLGLTEKERTFVISFCNEI